MLLFLSSDHPSVVVIDYRLIFDSLLILFVIISFVVCVVVVWYKTKEEKRLEDERWERIGRLCGYIK